MLDPIIGTQHFAVELSKAKQIFSELSSKLPGYLLPRLVVEQPGAANKILI
jgi:L-lysine 2,3-aminomutase